MKRKEIMENCPEEFKDTLKDFIDDVESMFGHIESLLDISNVESICQVSDAYDLAKQAATDLY